MVSCVVVEWNVEVECCLAVHTVEHTGWKDLAGDTCMPTRGKDLAGKSYSLHVADFWSRVYHRYHSQLQEVSR